jgi:hypothetical protein
MNIAPCFFKTIMDALYSAIIICTYNLLNNKSESGFEDFLRFINNNLSIFKISELQRRRGYPDKHWMLNREKITCKTVEKDQQRIRRIKALPSIKLRRDKTHAHLDKDYFFERDKISKRAPLKWSDFDEIINIMKDILNTYSSSYDGNLFEIEVWNINDIDSLLDRLHSEK